MEKPSYLKLKNGGRLAYRKVEGRSPGILFLGGFRSDMTGVKATALESFARERGIAFVRFDYRGHGHSSGDFEGCTVSTWVEDALIVMSKVTKGPQILIGSSMGGWLALLLAAEKSKRVVGVIGIAAAPDFTENLIWDALTAMQKDELKRKGKVMVPSACGEHYPITRALIEDGRQYLLLGAEIPVFCPVRLLHGMKDSDVPWEMSFSINEKLATKDVKTILIDDGDHRLSEPKDVEKLLRVAGKLVEQLSRHPAI